MIVLLSADIRPRNTTAQRGTGAAPVEGKAANGKGRTQLVLHFGMARLLLRQWGLSF
jgi:hypothetical protein